MNAKRTAQPIRKVWKYRLRDIASLAGISIHTVRLHKKQGKFKPESLGDVLLYVIDMRLLRGLTPDEALNRIETIVMGVKKQ